MAALLTGCGTFYERPVIEDQLIYNLNGEQEIGTLAVTAQRRLIIANLKTGRFCSEPPPEAADSITSAIATALKANISPDKNASAELASNFARHVNQLYKRSHTVQLFRDAAFYLCVDAVNNANQRGEYDSYKEAVTKMVEGLKPAFTKEIEKYYEAEIAKAKNPPPVSQEMVICDSTASVGNTSNSADKKLSTSITCRPLAQMIEKKETK
uniref:Uncharacterized protein n=1 Tax=Candidatus Kentrum sp. LPFa TaxID=2126335 RepID=A0A450WT39_9GAMM|nr:MAG: hypothetical protein BECKLPF1236A_GA0070988_102511 [Candidatus Kentron sp. LPFa]VFK30618.1 MAG: hypothetical protein BECKLPF1236C_GA0070990_101161 [Candidatus Kentron sp. LPFa]